MPTTVQVQFERGFAAMSWPDLLDSAQTTPLNLAEEGQRLIQGSAIRHLGGVNLPRGCQPSRAVANPPRM